MTKKTGVQATRGHLASNGGLRGHSVGDNFPVIISRIGTFDNLQYLVTAPDGARLKVNQANTAQNCADAWLGTRRATEGEKASHYVLSKVKNFGGEGEDTRCETVPDIETDFDFYGIYAYDVDGYAYSVWDTESNGFGDWLEAGIVYSFLYTGELSEPFRNPTRGPKS